MGVQSRIVQHSAYRVEHAPESIYTPGTGEEQKHQENVQILRKKSKIKRGNSIFLFPGGMRPEYDKMKPFREGAFVLAKRRDIPILPLVISGSRNALPQNGWIFPTRVHMDITILDEISPETFHDTTSRNLANRVQNMISAALNQKKESRYH